MSGRNSPSAWPCSKGRQQLGAAAASDVTAAPAMTDLAALPQEVLAIVVAQLPPCEAVQLQRVSRSFWRAGAAGEELKADVLNKLLQVLSEDGQSARAALAACAARRWLARNAAGCKVICSYANDVKVTACTRLVSCLPALESVRLSPIWPSEMITDDVACLLEALAWCPRLRALNLFLFGCKLHEDPLSSGGDDDLHWPFPDAAAFENLHGLTKLDLAFDKKDQLVMADIVSALMPLTALADLRLASYQPADVPAALGHFKGLQSLTLHGFSPCVLEAGCLDLPNLLSLEFLDCGFEAQILPSVTSLQCLTRISFSGEHGKWRFDPQLVQLPRLKHLVFSHAIPWDGVESGAAPELLRLPADMGLLRSSLLHVELGELGLLHFPLALTQLAALEYLDASENDFEELPAAITALSRLSELRFGRVMSYEDPLQLRETRRLDVRALGDLSAFPALRELTFNFCEVRLCRSVLGAVRHACLTKLCFFNAHPAPVCAPVVLQLNRELRRLGRGSVVRFVSRDWG